MRLLALLAMCGLSAVLAGTASPAADSPDALLKPLAPAKNSARVRLPVTDAKTGPMRLAAQVPHGKKKNEYIDITVAIGLGDYSAVATKTLTDWGYTAKVGTKSPLLELRFPGVQIAPAVKEKDGSDVAPRLAGVSPEVVNPPADAKNKLYDADILLGEFDLYQIGGTIQAGPAGYAARTANLPKLRPRLAFDDGFLELTVPGSALMRFKTSEGKLPEVTAAPAPGFVKVVAPTDPKRYDAFVGAAVNNLKEYQQGGQTVPVNVVVSPLSNWPTGIVITAGVAHGCKADWKPNAAGQAAVGVQVNSAMVEGTLNEFRISFFVDGDSKKPMDFVLNKVPVMVDPGDTGSTIWLGPTFFATHFKDAVYAFDEKGVWKLHARCDEKKYLQQPKKP